MSEREKIVKKLLKHIEQSINDFDAFIPGKQKQVYEKVVELLKSIETNQGSIVNSSANLDLINKVVKEFESIVDDKRYQKQIVNFAGAFTVVSELQNSYFSSLAKDFKRQPVLNQIKKQSIESVVNKLTETGAGKIVSEAVRSMLLKSVTGGAKYTDLLNHLQDYILTNEKGSGILQRYTKQITTDALNEFSATYSQSITSDLGLEWYEYVGSNITTTRPWCEHMTAKRWIHISEFNTVLHDNIDGVKIGGEEIPIYNKTKLPQGMKADTTKDNLLTNRGGWECGHQFVAVSENLVPRARREAVYRKLGVKVDEEGFRVAA